MMILTAFINSVTDMEIFTIQEQHTGGVLKIQIKVSQNSAENTYARVSF